MNINIRQAKKEIDHQSISYIASNSPPLVDHGEYIYWIMTYCHSGYIFVAELEDSPVGFVTTLPIDSDQGHIYFWQLGVLPKYRNAGIGSKLVRHVLSNRSVVEFSVNIDPGNKPSLIIFEFGARSIGKCLQDMKISKNSPEAKVFAKYGENLYRSK